MVMKLLFLVTFSVVWCGVLCSDHVKPNIIFVLVDDVGWADFNYNIGGKSVIPTPHLDKLAAQGVILKQHYVHSSCTPSRASFMTGRYSANTGLPCAMFPGSVAGLPDDMATMPQLLRKAGYSAHMVGKWHIGHSQWKQGPVGRGFESHSGSFMWNLESYSKLMWKNPLVTMGADWGKSFENGSYVRMAEPKHATIAITDAAINLIKDHEKSQPLFLYVSYNAAHTPLQPEASWEEECQHVPHLWRRQYCGMMVGLDRNIARLVKAARQGLGEDTVVVVTSDNGGSVWFGGLNTPLRSGKLTPFEGGVKVPGFVLDLSGKLEMKTGSEFHHMFHISDWLPTFLSWAGAAELAGDLKLDGIDQSEALKRNLAARSEVLLELFTDKESHDGSESLSYRKGKYKLIQGNIRDPHWYSEPSSDQVATSDESWLPRIIERFIRLIEKMFGNGPIDVPWDIAINMILFNQYARQHGRQVLLFDVEKDPEERHDISAQHPKVVKDIIRKIDKIKIGRPYHPKYWMMSPNWTSGFISGDCSKSDLVASHGCKFAHHWIPDSSDLRDEESLGLEDAFAVIAREDGPYIVFFLLIWPFIIYAICSFLFRGKGKQKKS